MIKRIFRVVVCFLLICCLVINISPIRAKAVEPVTMVMVSAATVIASVMIGIGVMMGQNREAFDQVVQMVQGSNAMKDFIQQDETKGDVIPLYRSPGNGGVGSGALSLLVAGALIEAIRQVLFEEKIVAEDNSLDGFLSYNGHVLPVVPSYSSYPYEIILWNRNTSTYFFSYSAKIFKYGDAWVTPYIYTSSKSSGADFSLDGSSWVQIKSYSSQSSRQYNLSAYDDDIYDYQFVWSSFDLCFDNGDVWFYATEPISASSIAVSEGLSAGEIAPQEQELSEGYSDWVAGSQWDVNNSQWWPIAVAPTYEETVTFPQVQVQKGEGTLKEEDLGENTDPEPDTDQVTASGLKGWIDGLKDRMTLLLQPLSLTVSNILDAVTAIPEAIVSPIKDFFTPSGNVEAYALDLKLLFPFCIPFDLFNLLKALQADPVAPHFEFELDFAMLGRFPVSVDFSEWNDLASLLRTLEMGLFIVGLAVGTRKLMGD